MSFEEMLNQSFKSTYTGEKVKGIVTGIAPNEITVDIGTKHTGYVPLSELTNDPSLSTEDIVKKGDEIELVVLRVNDVEGTVMLSKNVWMLRLALKRLWLLLAPAKFSPVLLLTL